MRRIRLLAAVAVLGLTSAMLGIAPPAGAATALAGHAGELHAAAVQAPPPQTEVFTLPNYNSHYCLGITNGEDNADAIQRDCTGSADELWNVGAEDGTSGYY